VEPLLHPFADAVNVLQFEVEQNAGQVVGGDAIGLAPNV
jgi:hypothetical protein